MVEDPRTSHDMHDSGCGCGRQIRVAITIGQVLTQTLDTDETPVQSQVLLRELSVSTLLYN
jgi:hypothetical protein